MTIIEMDRDGDTACCIRLQYDEEQQVAEAVMKILGEPSFRGDHREFLERVFWDRRARFGARLWAEDIHGLMDVFDVWSKRGWFECSMPKFLDGNEAVLDTNSTQLNMGSGANTANLILLIWKHAYDKNRADLIKLDDKFQKFVGSKEFEKRQMLLRPQAQLDRALEIECAFWDEVEKVKAKPPLNPSSPLYVNWKEAAYKWVLDYMPRGRDVIPNVLMVPWLKQEAEIVEVMASAVHPEEDWLEEARAFSAKEIATGTGYGKEEKNRINKGNKS